MLEELAPARQCPSSQGIVKRDDVKVKIACIHHILRSHPGVGGFVSKHSDKVSETSEEVADEDEGQYQHYHPLHFRTYSTQLTHRLQDSCIRLHHLYHPHQFSYLYYPIQSRDLRYSRNVIPARFRLEDDFERDASKEIQSHPASGIVYKDRFMVSNQIVLLVKIG